MIQFLSALLLLFSVQSAEAVGVPVCAETLIQGATHQFGPASDVSGGPIIRLADDTKLSLAGLAIPAPPRDPKDAAAVESAAAAEAYLKSLLAGSQLLATPGFRADRHGRHVVQLVAVRGGQEAVKWVQAEMVRAGHARVWPSRRGTACAAFLLKLEAEARGTKQGLWALKRNEVVEAWATRKLRARENTFQLVEGTVEAVAETKRFTFLNFGKDWRTDFTATISARAAKRFKKDGFSAANLKGKHIRVRGWVRYANGPSISVRMVEQIELLGADDK